MFRFGPKLICDASNNGEGEVIIGCSIDDIFSATCASDLERNRGGIISNLSHDGSSTFFFDSA